MGRLIGLLFVMTLLTSCTPWRILLFNKPSIDDKKPFPTSVIEPGENPFHFTETDNFKLPPMNTWVEKEFTNKYQSLEEFLIRSNTTSFMVIRNDSILYEKYFGGYFKENPALIFSVTKSFLTTLVGIALEEGLIPSLDTPVYHYIPEFANDDRKKITIEHLLHMTSGLHFSDYRTPFKLSNFYYTKNSKNFIKRLDLFHEPGKAFVYKSVDTQLLGICLEQAIGRSVSDYLKEKLWHPLGMEYPAYFTMDRKDGIERMYGGLMACTRDLAKLARLFLNDGVWEGKQIISKDWISTVKSKEIDRDGWWGYAFGWWRDVYLNNNLKESNDYFAAGFGGQFVYVNPNENLIIVRQGRSRKKIEWNYYISKLAYVLQGDEVFPKEDMIGERKDLIGKYTSLTGEEISLEYDQKKKRWNVEGCKDIHCSFEEECAQSLYNPKKRLRIIFDKTNNKATGLYLDDYKELNYFTKMD